MKLPANNVVIPVRPIQPLQQFQDGDPQPLPPPAAAPPTTTSAGAAAAPGTRKKSPGGRGGGGRATTARASASASSKTRGGTRGQRLPLPGVNAAAEAAAQNTSTTKSRAHPSLKVCHVSVCLCLVSVCPCGWSGRRFGGGMSLTSQPAAGRRFGGSLSVFRLHYALHRLKNLTSTLLTQYSRVTSTFFSQRAPWVIMSSSNDEMRIGVRTPRPFKSDDYR